MARTDIFYGGQGYGDITDTQRFALWGSGSPQSAVTADIGSMYYDTATGNVWSKTSGTGDTGWIQLAAAGSVTAKSRLCSATYQLNINTVYGNTAATKQEQPNADYPQGAYSGGSIVAVAARCVNANATPYGSPTTSAGSVDFYVYKNGQALTPATSVTNSVGAVTNTYAAGTYTFGTNDILELWAGTTGLTTGGTSGTFVASAWIAL